MLYGVLMSVTYTACKRFTHESVGMKTKVEFYTDKNETI